MDSTNQAQLVAQHGLDSNTDQRGRRQVTLIEQEVWQALMTQLSATLPPVTRRANLMLSGIRLAHTRHQLLRLGTCRIRILGETKPCERMEEAYPGLQAAMYDNWAGGAFGEVLDTGTITVGDPVSWDIDA